MHTPPAEGRQHGYSHSPHTHPQDPDTNLSLSVSSDFPRITVRTGWLELSCKWDSPIAFPHQPTNSLPLSFLHFPFEGTTDHVSCRAPTFEVPLLVPPWCCRWQMELYGTVTPVHSPGRRASCGAVLSTAVFLCCSSALPTAPRLPGQESSLGAWFPAPRVPHGSRLGQEPPQNSHSSL